MLFRSNKKTHDVAAHQANRGAHTVGESKQPEPAVEPEPSATEEASAEPKAAESSDEKKVCAHFDAR